MIPYTGVLENPKKCAHCKKKNTAQWRRGPDGEGIFFFLFKEIK